MNTKLTVVYDADTIQDVKALLDAHPWSAMSHSHAIHERDAALREIERLQKRVAEMQEPHAAGHEDAARIAERFEFFALDHTPDGWPAVQQRQLNEAAAELRRLLNLLGKANALAAIRAKRIKELEVQLDAVGAGGVEPLRKRECLHKISEPAQPVGLAIFAENGNGLMWTQSRQHAEATAKDIGLHVTPLYAAPQSAAARNTPLYDPDDVAFPVQRSADGTDAPTELTSIAAEEVAAVEVAAPSGAAHKPLTEEQMHKDLAVLCKRIFNTRIGKACSNCDGGTYQSDNNEYGQFHRCSKCRYVPMWGEDGSEFGITAAQKGGQHGTE